jgi:O-methyltransferase involved in polyketide biosynthesis
VIHGQDMLKGNNTVAFIQGSALKLQAVLNHPGTMSLIDLSRPVGVVMMGLFHFFSIDECQHIVEKLRKELKPGSLIGISHGNGDALSNQTSSQSA